MKTLLFISFFSFSLAFAQNANHNWYLGLKAGGGKSFRTIEMAEFRIGNNVADRNKHEISQPAKNLGFLVGKRLFHRFWLEGEYGLSHLSFLYEKEVTNGSFTYRNKSDYYNNDISLSLKFYTNQGKLKGFLVVGPEANIIMKWKTTLSTTPYDKSVEPAVHVSTPKIGHNWFTSSIQGGAGLTYQLNNRLSLESRFMLKQNLIPSRTLSDIEERLNYKAVNIGLLISL